MFAFLVAMATNVVNSQSLYSNAVMSLNPVAYWPLQETTQPPRADVETNLGFLGQVANAYYSSTNAAHGQPGAITGDSDTAVNFLGNANSSAFVPTTDNRVSLATGQPFTVECWARATSAASFVSMINQTASANNAGGHYNTTNACGWSLCQNFASYRGTLAGNNPPCFSFHVFNGIGFTSGAEAEVNNSGIWLNNAAQGYVNSWVYLVGVFDGTNAWLYMYSTNLNNSVNGGTSQMNFQCPVTTGVSPVASGFGSPVAGATFQADTWDPILFGQTRSYSGNPYHGSVDEVAIYTNALTYTQITNHYAAATNGLGTYMSTILADSPAMYWRMDAPAFVSIPLTSSSLPTFANYGSAGGSMTNFNTHGTSGVIEPGVVVGSPGPQYAGFGALTNSFSFNGLVGAADAGYNAEMDPTDVTNNFTVVTWFKPNPEDNNRFNAVVSHSDSSWKIQLQNGNTKGYKGVGGQANIAPTNAVLPVMFNIDDGNWHMATLESSCVSGVGTNVTLFLDDGTATAFVQNNSAIPGKPTMDVFIGNGPEYLEPTNHATYNTAQQTFAGRVAHVAYFTNLLTASQIRNLFYTAEPAPVILGAPVTTWADLNGAFTNTVTVGGTGPFFYQWYSNGVAIGGQIGASLILNPVVAANAGSYYVVITNASGAATSAPVSLTVVSNLEFIVGQFPISYTNPITLYGGTNYLGTNYLGSSPTFSAMASGALPISYKWMTNGVAMGGATNSSLTFTNCQVSSPTNFYCVVTNVYGAVTSMVWSVQYLTTLAPFPQAVFAAKPVAYWRLNEPDDGQFDGNPGAIANDYSSGNNGLYTNVYLANALGGSGYSPATDPTEQAAQFGAFAASGCFVGAVGTNIDFSVPSGGNAEFTVMAWANGNATAQPGSGTLVGKGFINFEEFALDEGAPGNDVRLFVRDANANAYSANTAVNLGADSNWHWVVGVCDQAHSNLAVYVDNILQTNVLLPANVGLFNASSLPLQIGARGTAGAYGSAQFKGFLNDAAVYNYAMTSNQVFAMYPSSPPFFVKQPASPVNIDAGGTLTITTLPAGSSPLALKWFDVNSNSIIAGQTNSTLVLSNMQASDSYYLTATNPYGGTNSITASVNVFAGIPTFNPDVQNPFFGLPGGGATNHVTAWGTLPLAYQWQFSNTVGWVNLANNSRINGAKSNFLTIANLQAGDVGNYQVVATNNFGSATSSVASLIVSGVLPLTLNPTNGWTFAGSARWSSGVLSMTDPGNGGGTSSSFFKIPQYIGAFTASFTYQAQFATTIPLADGLTFCLQDDSRGAAASGSGGGQLGFGTIVPSVALQFNIFPGNGVGGMGYAIGYNGNIGSTAVPGSVSLTNGPVDVSMYYASGQLALTLSNEVNAATFSTNLAVGDITGILGSQTAYVGFTASYGGDTSVQTIQNFQFISIPITAINLTGTNALLSWSGAIVGNYGVLQNTNLLTTNWLSLTNQSVLTNNLNQVIVPQGGNNLFYRLLLQQ